MYFRTTLLLTLLTVLLGSWIIWVEPRLKTTATLEWESRNILNFSAQDCRQIEFKSGDHFFRIQKRSDQSFSLEIPEPSIQANEAFVTKVLGRFGNLNRSAILPLKCPPTITQQQFLERYQLQAPIATVSFFFQDGTQQCVAFGKQDTEHSYAQINQSPEIQILPLDLFSLATPDLEQLRDPYVIHLNPPDLIALEIQKNSDVLRLEKTVPASDYDGWRQTAPYTLPVDSDALFLLMDTLKNQTTQQYHLFSTLESEFSHPLFQVTFWTTGQSLAQKLILCEKDQNLYAHTPPSLWVRSFQKDSFLQNLQLPAWKYIERDVFPVQEPDGLAFELAPSRHLAYQREQKHWWKQDPAHDKIEIPFEILQPVLDTIHILQMVDLIAWEPVSLNEYGLDAPIQQWKVTQAGKTLALKIGKPFNTETLYAIRQDLPLVFTLNKAILANLSLRLGESELYVQNAQLQKEVKEQFLTPEKK